MKTVTISPDTVLRLVSEEVARISTGMVEVLAVSGVALTGEAFPIAGVQVQVRPAAPPPPTHPRPTFRVVGGTDHMEPA